jgi:hypothetical protein
VRWPARGGLARSERRMHEDAIATAAHQLDVDFFQSAAPNVQACARGSATGP